jgi:GNAT superfamily N-acetyltransferase
MSFTQKGEPKATTTTSIQWVSVLVGSQYQAEPGIRFLKGTTRCFGEKRPIEILEYRDRDGWLRGVVSWEGESVHHLFIMVDPECRRQGIATKLMREAVKRWPIDFQKQSYTRDGAKFFRKFLLGSDEIGDIGSPQQKRASGGDPEALTA